MEKSSESVTVVPFSGGIVPPGDSFTMPWVETFPVAAQAHGRFIASNQRTVPPVRVFEPDADDVKPDHIV